MRFVTVNSDEQMTRAMQLIDLWSKSSGKQGLCLYFEPGSIESVTYDLEAGEENEEAEGEEAGCAENSGADPECCSGN